MNNISRDTSQKTPVVVIIGGGFGGLAAARGLEKENVKVILIDRTNHHLFQPLLYQVATAGLSPADIAQPIRGILRKQKNTTVLLDEVIEIRPEQQELQTHDHLVQYDYLIVAAGARHHYFGNNEWEIHAPGLKTLADAIELRRRILLSFEIAEKATTDAERKQAMTFVVVGGGPTGVEMAGAISELARHTLRRDFRQMNPEESRVILVEAAPRILLGFSEDLSQSAERQLNALGVEIQTGKAITHISPGMVEMGEEKIAARTVVWAAGNKASPLASMLGAETDRQGRVQVNPDLTIPGRPEIQAIGDMITTTYADQKPVPGVSPAAIQAGTHAAKNIIRQIQGKSPLPWHYFDKGSMATLGRHAAVAQIGKLKLKGYPAWLAWVFVHLIFLIGFRNRLAVFFQWAWAYFTYSKGARLISQITDQRAYLSPDTSITDKASEQK